VNVNWPLLIASVPMAALSVVYWIAVIRDWPE